jgi:hypothetical protein
MATMSIQPFLRICPIKAILLQLFENQSVTFLKWVALKKAGAKVKFQGGKKGRNFKTVLRFAPIP